MVWVVVLGYVLWKSWAIWVAELLVVGCGLGLPCRFLFWCWGLTAGCWYFRNLFVSLIVFNYRFGYDGELWA